MGAPLDQILKNFNGYVDGRGYSGNIEELQLPNIEILEEDFKNGGLFAAVGVEMGMAKLESSMTLTCASPDILSSVGIGPGNEVPFIARGALESFGGKTDAVQVRMTGRIRMWEPSAWQAGQKHTVKLSFSLWYYAYISNGKTIHEIDVLNMKFIVNGVDRYAAQRAAIGL